MDSDLYSILALGARYLFLTLMLAILGRAWFMTVRDNRKGRALRDSCERSGVGQFLIGKRGKRRPSVPIPREGVLGSSPRADVRVRSRGVKRMHFSFEETEGGLLITPRPRCAVTVKGREREDSFLLRDGEAVDLGATRLTLSLYGAASAEEPFDDAHIWGTSPRPDEDERENDDLKRFEDELWPDE